MNWNDLAYLGKLVKIHGVRGALIMRSQEEDLTKILFSGEPVFVDIDKKPVPFFLADISCIRKGEYVILFEDVHSPGEALYLKNRDIYCEKTQLKENGQNIFSPHDLVGFSAFLQPWSLKGTIKEFMDIQSNPVLLISLPEKEVWIPFREEFIEWFEPERQRISFRLPNGLVDL